MNTHSFHIPVMGIGYTIDTPLKVSQYGIDSVISLVDDILLEKLRKMYCAKFTLPYEAITNKMEDFRAQRITSYLNLINDLATKKFEDFVHSTAETIDDLKDYIKTLPEASQIKQKFLQYASSQINFSELGSWMKANLRMGTIDVNIMTKVDKENYIKKEQLPVEYNDAHAALRGFAKSNLSSSLILSAGMNPRLYSYLDQFEDFFPNSDGVVRKRIVLKVSDYRSALIQGKFLAKKGLWVSEYRVESGLNCGGHAFATDGFLMGPILEQFKENRQELIESVHEILISGLSAKNRVNPKNPMQLRISAQGGVGTAKEHDFILNHYGVDSVGWGSPFLLVPEATTVDKVTRDKLCKAVEDDLYLSDISPLGVPFNNLKSNTKDEEKLSFISKGRPGSSCPKKYLALNKEFAETGICTASRQYQDLKLKELADRKLTPEEFKSEYDKIVEKSCICVGLGTSTLLNYEMDTKAEGNGVSICPGPNMAYFSKEMSLKEITDHIYGRKNVITRTDRPNMFIKELNLYIDFLKNKFVEIENQMDKKQEKYFVNFINNLREGISYYENLYNDFRDSFVENDSPFLHQLRKAKIKLEVLNIEVAEFNYSRDLVPQD
jgi:hypothetical protein